MKELHLVTAEAVRAGHPDKFCDQIADSILDSHLRRDPDARVAVEAFATAGKILVAGEVTSKATVDYKRIVWKTIGNVHYRDADLCADSSQQLEVEVRIHEQSPDIDHAVGSGDDMGAGDQGIMVGYATDETAEYLPLPVVLAQSLCHELDKLKLKADWLGADGKAQVTVAYEHGKPVAVTTIVISTQHIQNVCYECMYREIVAGIIRHVIPEQYMVNSTTILLNPSGQFVLGGPVADTGLTGRKLAVDQYGPAARLGGGALSGKDPTKVDRSGAYAARWVAKNIVAAGLASACEVQIAYAIGRAKPVSVSINTQGTGVVPDAALSQAVESVFDLRPSAIIKQLDLRRPIYAPLATYGHYGRPELELPWEQTNKRTALIASVLKQGFSL